MTTSYVIMAGTMITKGGKQLKWPRVTRDIGKVLSLIGWLVVAFLTGVHGKKSICYQAIFGVLTVLITGMIMEQRKVSFKEKYPKSVQSLLKQPDLWILQALYVFGWFMIGRGVGMGRGRIGKTLSLVGTMFGVGSALYVLPYQRKKKVVDGPGVMLCTLTWVFLSVAYSTRN